jgi:glutaredoxin 3
MSGMKTTSDAAPIVLYKTAWCGYCRQAEQLLTRLGIAYEAVDCTDDPACREWLVETTGRTTVPQIFVHGRAIGGYTDLAALARTGELDKILAVRS